MRMILTAFFAFFVSISTCYAEAPGRQKQFGAESFTLRNGMQVVVIPIHRVPVVTHMVWYGVGAADEAPGQSGLAHFVEHLMFKGTKTVPPGEFSKRVRALGGNDNAFTGQDFTAYFQSIAAEHLETVMTMEADRMKNLIFPPEDVDSERLVVIEERRQRTENEPTGYFFEHMRNLLFVNHPYGNPTIGWLHEVKSLNRDNVMNFYRTWYAPNNAALIISGDVTAAQVGPLAEKTYGRISARAVPARDWTEVPPLLGLPRLVMRHPAIEQPAFYRLYRAPSLRQSKPDSLALEVLSSIMIDGQRSRLYKALVVEQKIATGVGFSYSSAARGDSVVTITATPAAGVPLESLETAIDNELRRLVREGVSDDELKAALTRLRNAYDFSRDGIFGPAMSFGQALMAGGTIDDVEYWAHDIQQLTTAQLQDVAKRFLDPDEPGKRPYVTGFVMPEEKAPEDTAATPGSTTPAAETEEQP